MDGTSPYVFVSGTVADREQAQLLADLLVEQCLVACVQLAPVSSTYRWQGKVEHAEEYAFAAKTRRTLVAAVIAVIERHHTYDVPEIIVTPIEGGHAPYLAWIGEATEGAPHV